MATTQTTTLDKANLLTSKPPPAPQHQPQRIRSYKDFLTPALHRRFTRAALLVLATCYLESILMAPPSLLWIWNPISFTGIRAVLLFLPSLFVFVVRVANMHCGELITSSPAETTWMMVRGLSGVYTLVWYVCGAAFFGEVYIWSRAKSSALGWVDMGREDEWALLNENPIFLRALFFCLAVAQTIVHLGRGDDRLPIPERDDDPRTQQQQATTYRIPKSILRLQSNLPTIALRTLRLVIPGIAFTIPVYFLLLRSWMWSFFYPIGRTLFPKLAHQTRPTGLMQLPRLTWQCFTSSILLVLLWELGNAFFTIYVAQPPLSKAEDEPLTGMVAIGEKSRDPNGSLITGLKSKRENVRTFAFWELSLICTYFETRRKTIYTEVDRAGGSTWSQISKFCMDEIFAIQTRIKAAQAPPQPQEQQKPPQAQPQEQQQPLGLPNIADKKVQSGDVWAKPAKSDYVHSVSNMAKSIGQHPNAQSPLVPRTRKAIEWSADRLLSKEEQQRLTKQGLSKEASSAMTRFLQTPLGEPFRQTFARRVKAVVFGAEQDGYSRRTNITHASRALSTLCAKSLKEDDYGQVAKSISQVIRLYVDTIKAVHNFVTGWEPSWTDVYFSERGDRRIGEVEVVVNELKKGLEEVVLVFGEYAASVGVTAKEMREARELVGKREEMTEI